ncbi:GlsB/YeaQ/YmgE family stress response membrane protein [Tengunoibacter tsumagoiensis]|uniref:Transglycosylase n=1 Tax=Tengunoibacter tsumagoiensis TaxID=2014871 RepID=A0A402A4F1_9CHLR|nr:GlsB/YeaQ/YmgE family stress response membrane protein [Tengunoibacter tsumagoiensis]GCE14034.1 transglycosylase [Tengunoibacter tsumagoiensis]
MIATSMVLGASLNPGGIITWLVVGLIAGFLASAIMRGGGYGVIGDVIVGLIGAFVGGLVANLLIPGQNFGFWGSIVVAFIGACVLIAILRAVSSRSSAL